ncbi:hypothetical protein FCV25MIE_13311 [Fagus crenata]
MAEEEVEKAHHSESESEKKMQASMTPWEQHSGVISIPRYDYKAPTSLLHHSLSGFLITCTIKREKSATKEAISILQKYLGSSSSGNSGNLENSDDNADAKKRKICPNDDDLDGESKAASNNSENTGGELSIGTCLSPVSSDPNLDRAHVLSLVKLIRSGLLLFTFPTNTTVDTVRIVSNIMESLESGISKSPLWCHRIFPIQATCSLNEKELQTVVSKLVLQFMNEKQQHEVARPVKFAVGYNRRGIEETEMKIRKDTSNGSDAFALLDRNKCFGIVAAAVKNAVSDSVVDLKAPEFSVLVELLPLSRVPNGSLVVAVSVLPQNLTNTKPRLCIKPLVSDSKAKGGKH